MRRICPRLIRLFLAAVFVFGGVFMHAGSVVYASSSNFGVVHEHVNHAETTPDSVDFSDTNEGDPSHALGICLDAHCCTPAVHTAAQNLQRYLLESGKLVFGPGSNYALSVAVFLLKPPRAIT
jgi:hypothetical protein